MLVPFTKKIAGEDDGDEDEDDGSDLEDDPNPDHEVEEGREVFDDEVVEKAMRDVAEEYAVSTSEAKVARSSVTKVCSRCSFIVISMTFFVAQMPRKEPPPFLDGCSRSRSGLHRSQREAKENETVRTNTLGFGR